MKRKQMQLSGAVLAAVLVAGISQGSILVRDEFNTTGGPDYANGLYESGSDIGDAGGNATCTGGSIVGFDSSKAWNQAGYFDAYANVIRLLHRTYGATYEGREISASVAGKTKAYARTSARMRSSSASASSAYAYGGFGGTAQLGSAGGATVGFNWDGSNWDLTLRYRNSSGVTTATIMEDITVNSTYGMIWEMDDTANTIKVWVDETDLNNAADLTVSWAGTITDISHMTFGFSETGSSGDIYYYDMMLGDTAQDVGAIPEPGTLSMFGLATFGALLIRRIRM